MFTRRYYAAYLDDPTTGDTAEPTRHEVEIRGSDQIDAEQMGKQIGAEISDRISMMFLLAWAALVRTEVYAGTYEEFRRVVVDVVPAGPPVPLDPTPQAAPSASASSSPLGLVEPPTGG